MTKTEQQQPSAEKLSIHRHALNFFNAAKVHKKAESAKLSDNFLPSNNESASLDTILIPPKLTKFLFFEKKTTKKFAREKEKV